MALDVGPNLAVDNHADGAGADVELAPKVSLRAIARRKGFPDLNDLFLGELRGVVPASLETVDYVLALRADPKVRGIYAGWVVAGVKDVEAGRNRPAITVLPGPTGSGDHRVAEMELSVAKRIAVGSPRPAPVRAGALVYFLPESLHAISL